MVYLTVYEQAVLDTILAEKLPHGLDYLQPELKLLRRLQHHDPTLPHENFANYINYIRAEILAYMTSEEVKNVVDDISTAELFRLLIIFSAALPLNPGAPSVVDPQHFVFLCHHDGSELSEDNLAVSVKGYWYNRQNLLGDPLETQKAKYARLKNHFSDLEIELNFGIKTPIEIPVDSQRYNSIQAKWLKKKKHLAVPWLIAAGYFICTSPLGILAVVTFPIVIVPFLFVLSLVTIILFKRANAIRILFCRDWADTEYKIWQNKEKINRQEQQLLTTRQIDDASRLRNVILFLREEDRRRNHLHEGQFNPLAYQFMPGVNVPGGVPQLHVNAIFPEVNHEGGEQKPVHASAFLLVENQEEAEQKPVPFHAILPLENHGEGELNPVPANIILPVGNSEEAEQNPAELKPGAQNEISIVGNRYSSFAGSPSRLDGEEKDERSENSLRFMRLQ